MIQCVGSRNDQNPNCSRICCQAAVKNAIHIKKLNPEAQVYILYRDIRTYGLLEDYYQEARKLGAIFFREVSIQSTYSAGPFDTRDALALLAAGAVDASALVSHRLKVAHPGYEE